MFRLGFVLWNWFPAESRYPRENPRMESQNTARSIEASLRDVIFLRGKLLEHELNGAWSLIAGPQ